MRNNKPRSTPLTMKIAVCLLGLSACSTPEVGRAVEVPCPAIPEPPSAIRDYAPPTVSYQASWRMFLDGVLNSLETPTGKPQTPNPAGIGP